MFANCDSFCIQVESLSMTSISSSSAKVSWTDKAKKGTSPTDSFDYGTNPIQQNLHATPSGQSVTLTGLTLNTVYYYTAGASNVCKTGVTSFSNLGGCLFTSSTGVFNCPPGTMSISAVSVTTSHSGTWGQFYWTVSPSTLNPPGNVASVALTVAGITYPGVTTGFTVTTLVASTTYSFSLVATANAYTDVTYRNSFNTNCVPTQVTGHVYLKGTGTGIYGAEIYDGANYKTQSDQNGFYQVAYGCASVNFQMRVKALGYDTSGVSTISGTATANQVTPNIDFNVPLWSTDQPGTVFWDENLYTSTFTAYGTPSQVANLQVRYHTSSSGSVLGNPPSGNAGHRVIWFSGNDTSSAATPHAYAAFDLGPAPSPFSAASHASPSLSAPIILSFNVFVYDPVSTSGVASVSSHFAVDALMSNSATLDSEQDVNGAPIFSSLRTNCNAADLAVPVDQWTTITCDLGGLANLNVTKFILVYDNGNGGVAGQINAFFDGIRLVEPIGSKAVVNGGFELANNPFGWIVLKGSLATIVDAVSGRVWQGNQSLRLGSTGSSGDTGSTNRVFQVLRLPNDLPSLASLTLRLGYNSQIAFGGGVDAYIVDQSASSQTAYLVPVGTGSSGGWKQASLDVTAREGHIITVTLESQAAPNSISYSYFDAVQLNTIGMTLNESANKASSVYNATLRLSRSVFDPSSGCTSHNFDLPSGFSATNSHWQTYYQGNTAEPIENNISLTADVWSLNHQCGSPHTDRLLFGVNAMANATGWARGTSGGFIGVQDYCLTESFSQTGDAVGAPTGWGNIQDSYNLGGAGYPAAAAASNALEDSAVSIAIDLTVEGIGYLLELSNPEIVIFSVAAEIAAALITWLSAGATAGTNPCSNPNQPLSQIGAPFDSNQHPPIQTHYLTELDADVGCTTIGSCVGGSYTITLKLTVDYCDNYAPNACNVNIFDTISTTLRILVITT
jgi:hypothetical protein